MDKNNRDVDNEEVSTSEEFDDPELLNTIDWTMIEEEEVDQTPGDDKA